MPEVLTALLSGLLSNVGLAEQEKGQGQAAKRQPGRRRPMTEYNGARGAKFAIQPGSALAKTTPPLVMAFELVETSRLWARTVAPVKPEWIEQVGGHVITRTVSEPRWSTRTATVIASERLTLFGVPIIAGRRTSYAAEHPAEAREIFIRSALVEGDWRTHNKLVNANRAALEEAAKQTDRMRRPDLLISDDALYTFYDARIPSHVVSGASFDKWLRGLKPDEWPRLTVDDCVTDPTQLRASDFPDRWVVGTHKLPVRYVFDPGAGADGATITVRVELLNQLSGAPFSWQVPGLRRELATELIRSLPKAVRTSFVPAPDFAAKALTWLEERGETCKGSFTDALGRALLALTGTRVEPGQWHPEAVPAHLRLTFQVIDNGREIARGDDLDELREKLVAKISAKLTASAGGLTASGQKSWTFGAVPTETTVAKGVRGYPALADEGNSVGLVVLDTESRARRSHTQGVRRLLTLTNPDPVRWVVSHMTMQEKLALAESPYPTVPELLADAWLKASEQLAETHGPAVKVRDAQAYEALALAVRQDCADQTRRITSIAALALGHVSSARRLLERFPRGDAVAADVSAQLEDLFFRRFISATPDPWYQHLPRYAEAAVLRLEAAFASPAKDRRLQAELDDVEQAYAELTDAQPPGPLSPEVEEVAFLIEELRVSLFAQRLRTAVPISSKRIRQAIRAAQ